MVWCLIGSKFHLYYKENVIEPMKRTLNCQCVADFLFQLVSVKKPRPGLFICSLFQTIKRRLRAHHSHISLNPLIVLRMFVL